MRSINPAASPSRKSLNACATGGSR
jgi:hypothetical protein